MGGSVYLASPFLLAHTFEGHYPHVWAAAWYPWAFWAFGQARLGRARGLLILPLVLAMTFLAGHPQEWLLLFLALAAWSAADAVAIWRSRASPICGATADRLRRDGGALARHGRDRPGATACRATLVAARPRRSLASAHSRRYHLEALNGFQLLSPTALGGPADYFGSDNYWETLLSIGLIPLFLAVLAVFRHPDRRLVRGWLVLVALALWFACGRHLLLYTALYYVVPGMSWFRVPARTLFLANLGAAVLAGLGVQTFGAAAGRARGVAAICRSLRRGHRADRLGDVPHRAGAPTGACDASVPRRRGGCLRMIASASHWAASVLCSCSGVFRSLHAPRALRGP